MSKKKKLGSKTILNDGWLKVYMFGSSSVTARLLPHRAVGIIICSISTPAELHHQNFIQYSHH